LTAAIVCRVRPPVKKFSEDYGILGLVLQGSFRNVILQRWSMVKRRSGAGIDLQGLARVGAEARLRELDRERANLLRAFPGLGGTSRRATSPAPPRKRKRKMTAAEKKAVSARMKKYWAAKRAEKK
jgi:hypothetical protein